MNVVLEFLRLPTSTDTTVASVVWLTDSINQKTSNCEWINKRCELKKKEKEKHKKSRNLLAL
jgi:hypothetical protein